MLQTQSKDKENRKVRREQGNNYVRQKEETEEPSGGKGTIERQREADEHVKTGELSGGRKVT